MKRRDPLRALAVGAAAVTVALTGAAFWLSYEHLHDVAAGNGLTGARAWAWPGTVDLFIVAGELLILRAALRGRFDWFAYLLAGVGSLGSIALNVAGVGADAQPMEYVVAAVPPTAALVAFGALMRQVHEALAQVAPEAPVPVGVPVVERVPEGVPAPSVQPGYAYPEITTGAPKDEPERSETEAPERVPAPVYPAAVPARTRVEVRAEYVPDVVPAGARLLPIVPRSTVHPRYVPDEPEDELTATARLDFTVGQSGPPSIRSLRDRYSIGSSRAQRIQREIKKGLAP